MQNAIYIKSLLLGTYERDLLSHEIQALSYCQQHCGMMFLINGSSAFQHKKK